MPYTTILLIVCCASFYYRVGEAEYGSGMLLALMVPRYACPDGFTLSPVFRFCVSVDRSYPAPTPGAPYKLGAFGVGLAVGLLLLFWRRAPWWLPPAVAVVAFTGTLGFTLQRSVGMPV